MIKGIISDARFMKWIVVSVISLIGMAIHQIFEFPDDFRMNVTLIVIMSIILGLIVYQVRKSGKGYFILLLFGLIHLIGGGLTVFPLGFLPFVPDQSIGHYISHLIYALTQIPLIYLSIINLATDDAKQD